ncbi:UL16-binding protein 1-like [Apodemus sylvaticus]|uniref:UL16-binding protein 1-like n=1 Tax=Apodemus sylvaticus TaxID=10129 RepID=UPI0022443837|nr:UL16-binding protein 1-like [Apodemus sylvaticus]
MTESLFFWEFPRSGHAEWRSVRASIVNIAGSTALLLQMLADSVDRRQLLQTKGAKLQLSFSDKVKDFNNFPVLDSATLCCSFNVSNPVSRGWSYDVQGEVNAESFLLNRNSECHVTDALGNKLNATDICEKQFRSLKDQVYHFKDVLYQIRGENKTITEPLTLQSIVCGSYAEDGHFRGSWKVNLNGSNMFHGDTKKWLHVNPGIKWTEDMLEKIRNLNDFLNKISQGEFRNKFKESTLHCEENLEPTALPTITAHMDQPASRACMSNPSILLIMLSCFLLYVF